MFRRDRLPQMFAAALAVAVGSTALADDVFVQEGVVVKPLSKSKQRKLERKLLRQPGSKVVIEGKPTATPTPEAIAGVKTRRSFRPLFGDRFARRNDVIVGAPVITSIAPAGGSSKASVTGPRSGAVASDPQVIPGSVDVTPSARPGRSPVISTPRGTALPVEPPDEPELELDRPASARILPPPADEIPPPVVSTPRSPLPQPAPAPLPTPPPAPAPASVPEAEVKPALDPGPAAPPSAGPPLEPPGEPRPA